MLDDQMHALQDQRLREAMAVEMAGLRRKADAHDEALALFENANKPTPGNLMDYVRPLAEEFNRMDKAEPGLRAHAERYKNLLSTIAPSIHDHMDINKNHEAGLIPFGTRCFLVGLAAITEIKEGK